MADSFTHRQLAVGAYNEAWALLETSRTGEDDVNLLAAAFTSRYHWRREGGSEQAVIADWMCSRCCAAVGEGRLAVRLAEAALTGLATNAPAWLHASVQEGLARAWAAARDHGRRAEHLRRARAALAQETDEEDAQIVRAQIDDVPEAGG